MSLNIKVKGKEINVPSIVLGSVCYTDRTPCTEGHSCLVLLMLNSQQAGFIVNNSTIFNLVVVGTKFFLSIPL